MMFTLALTEAPASFLLFPLGGSGFIWDRSNPTACAGNVGLDKDSGLHTSLALVLAPTMNLFN